MTGATVIFDCIASAAAVCDDIVVAAFCQNSPFVAVAADAA